MSYHGEIPDDVIPLCNLLEKHAMEPDLTATNGHADTEREHMTWHLARTGERRQFESGAHRDANNDKGRMDLLPWLGLIRLSKHFQKGAATHGERNWEKGIPCSVLMDSALRHLAKAQAGMTDENHLDAAFWNVSCLVDTLERIKQGTMDAKLNDVKGLS